MTNNNHNSNDDSDRDLHAHGVHSIIPDDGEYYTLKLGRTFDDSVDDDVVDGLDIASADPHNLDTIDEPAGSSSIYEDATLVRKQPDYQPSSTNAGGPVGEAHIVDEDNSTGYNVGDAGHMGIDEDTG